MVLKLVPDALELRKASRISLVNFCELFEAKVCELLASLERLERSTRCLEGSCSIQLSYRDTTLPVKFITSLLIWSRLLIRLRFL